MSRSGGWESHPQQPQLRAARQQVQGVLWGLERTAHPSVHTDDLDPVGEGHAPAEYPAVRSVSVLLAEGEQACCIVLYPIRVVLLDYDQLSGKSTRR